MPYLDKLHREFGDDLLVIAINGFNDDIKEIEEFAKETELILPVGVNANQLAKDTFFVTSYPTSFWVEQTGKVVHRSTGFEESDFSKIKKRLIEAMSK